MPPQGTQTCTDQHAEHRFIAFSAGSKRMHKAAAAADDRVDQGSLGRKRRRPLQDQTRSWPGRGHGGSLGLEGRSKFKELLAAGAPRHPIGRFRPRRPGGSGTFSNFELWAPEVAF